MSGLQADRVALVGAASQTGREVKDQLARAGIPGHRIELLDLDDQVGLITEYGDEARVVLEAAEESIRRFAVACFCGDPATARHLAPLVVERGGLAIDCTGGLADSESATPTGALDGEPGLEVPPHPAALLLGRLAAVLDFDAVAATLLLPASIDGERGADRMANQAAALLNFGARTDEDDADESPDADDSAAADSGPKDDEPAARRVAFDLWVEPTERGRVLAAIERAGLGAPRLEIVRAPIFHGLAAALFVHGHDADSLRAALAGADVVLDEGAALDSPARVAGVGSVHVTGIRTDGGGAWLWAVADNWSLTATAAVAEIVAALAPDDETIV